jgi:hypothetical protein
VPGGGPDATDPAQLAHSIYNNPGIRSAVVEWIALCTLSDPDLL